MNGIEEAIDAISSAGWAELLADGVEAIIFIAGIFMLIKQGKRLLRMAASDESEALHCSHCGCPFYEGEEWEEGFVCMECLEGRGDHDAHVDDYDAQLWDGAELQDKEDHDAHVDAYDAQLWDGAEPQDEEDKAGHYEEYHELLDSGDEEAAKQLAEEHGLDVDWDRLIREQIQDVIDRGDFALADSMCDEAGIDKLELDWH